MMKIATVENNILAIIAGTFTATIAAEEIEAQFHALTHFPDRRAKIELGDLAERLNQFAAHVVELWNKACAPIPEQEIEAFARRHVDLTWRYWAAEGRCMNWSITGPARFPVARNEKRMRISDARRADLKAHEAAARKAAKRKAFPHGGDDEPIRSGDPVALQKIMTRIEETALAIDRMKAANAIIRRMEKDLVRGHDCRRRCEHRPFPGSRSQRHQTGAVAVPSRIHHDQQPRRASSPATAPCDPRKDEGARHPKPRTRDKRRSRRDQGERRHRAHPVDLSR